MSFRRHVTRGSILVKLLKLYLLLLFFFFKLIGRRIGNYKPPPSGSGLVLGYFKRTREIAEGGAEEYFEKKGRKNTCQDIIKPNSISIVRIESEVLVKKKYEGVQGVLRFYTELICLHALKCLTVVPKIKFVSYGKQEIFIEFVSGVCLNRCASFDASALSGRERTAIQRSLLKAVRDIHSNRVIIYDLQLDNIILDGPRGPKAVFIDFADSLPAHLIPQVVRPDLEKRDIRHLEQKVIPRIYE